MIYLYKYIWYTMYLYNRRYWYTDDQRPAMIQSFTYVCLLIILNVMTALFFFDEYQLVKQFLALAQLNKFVFMLILFSLPVAIISYWIPGERYKRIVKDFDNFTETGTDRQKALISATSWVYQIGTWALFFMSVFNGR